MKYGMAIKISHTAWLCTIEKEKDMKLGDYDIWYAPCRSCGYDTGKSTKPQSPYKTCWKCGGRIHRDYSDRALKKNQIKEKRKVLPAPKKGTIPNRLIREAIKKVSNNPHHK